jgi:NAD(P)H-dependent flavin oxidoreductase YrpB (nitropropane dioxygenase family)
MDTHSPTPLTPASTTALPTIIQGGMGVGVSSWQLASQVAQTGQLGVVSGTALDLVLARRLQDGDPTGEFRRALAAFPIPGVADRTLATYFKPGGRAPGVPYRPTPRLTMTPRPAAQELTVLGNFVEVWLAKEGHDGTVGINYLEKIQMATPASAYGAMLAGVDYVLMGAGLPRDIPHLLDELAQHRPVALPVHVVGGAADAYTAKLDPVRLFGANLPAMTRPTFLAIVSAHVLSTVLAREEHTRPDGFVVEGPRAGGHNTRPRGKLVIDDAGEPVFAERDYADIAKVAECGLPFWLAGAYGTPERLVEALSLGAAGVQVGTVFALAEESGFLPEFRHDLIARLGAGTLEVKTDLLASPTGFPFKVAQVPGTLSSPTDREARFRVCDLSFLRTPFIREGGALDYRCPSEPIAVYVRKGGDAADTDGKACLCNALAVNIGLAQERKGTGAERALLTLGDDLAGPRILLETYPTGWTGRQAVEWLLSAVLERVPALAMEAVDRQA